MGTKNKGRGSVERIVQKLPIDKDQAQGNSIGPKQDAQHPAQPRPITLTEPARAIQQHHTTINTQISPTTTSNIPVTILIESDSDHNVMPEEPALIDSNVHQERPPNDSTRIGENEINISIEHSLSDDERCIITEQVDSPHSSYSTAPSEMPHRIAQEQSPISSLDPEDIDQLNTIFDN